MSENKQNLPAWDLSDLYHGINDPKINADMEDYRQSALTFAEKYKGRLANLSLTEVAEALDFYEKMLEKKRTPWQLCISQYVYADEK